MRSTPSSAGIGEGCAPRVRRCCSTFILLLLRTCSCAIGLVLFPIRLLYGFHMHLVWTVTLIRGHSLPNSSTGFRAEASDNRFSPSFPSEFEMGRRTHISYELRTEASDALTSLPSHTAVKNSIGPCVKELSCERLRFCVTVGIVIQDECFIRTPHIMKGRVEVCHILAHLQARF